MKIALLLKETLRKEIKDVSNLVEIGSVIGVKSDLVDKALKSEGIVCSVSGNEIHRIAVPRHLVDRAIEILKNDSKQNGYEIRWKSP